MRAVYAQAIERRKGTCISTSDVAALWFAVLKSTSSLLAAMEGADGDQVELKCVSGSGDGDAASRNARLGDREGQR